MHSLYEGMSAGLARAEGVKVPVEVPDDATLRFRERRYVYDGPTPSLDDFVPSGTVRLETLWRWEWRMAYDVGPNGVPDVKHA